jgi:hypothetical protein
MAVASSRQIAANYLESRGFVMHAVPDAYFCYWLGTTEVRLYGERIEIECLDNEIPALQCDYAHTEEAIRQQLATGLFGCPTLQN